MRLSAAGAATLYSGLLVDGVADSEAVTTLSATTGKHLAAVGGAHATTEAMLVGFLTVRGLECTFHFLSLFFSCSENFSQNAVQNYSFFSNYTSVNAFLQKSFCFFSQNHYFCTHN